MKVDLVNPGTVAISASQLKRARAVFEAAVAEQGAKREALLQRECNGDALRAWVDQMIAADALEQPVLDRPLGKDGSLKPGDSVGKYRIVREIGAGGMGSVYEAKADEDGSPVAIKVLRWQSLEISRRFEQEQSILSGLRHPNIARLLDSGTTSGFSPYFVMEYVEGAPIHTYCDKANLLVDARVRLFRQVCRAVVYLHQNLVVHRDLKPGNVLVTSDGTVKLVDFGIAKLLHAQDGIPSPVKTIAGLMTPDYASPEQIRGGATSTLTDVYSLGVLLYELLAGERPFTGPSDQIHETLRRICEDEPQKPSAAAAAKRGGRPVARLRGELDNIVLKAIRKEPERRYGSVEQFDEDLRRYLDGQPVLAQGDSLRYRARKFAVRYKGAVGAAAAILLVLSGGVVATSIEARIARNERARAEEQAKAAESAREQAEVHRREAEELRARAESKAAEADRERANAERRLGELRKLADGAVRVYQANANSTESSALAAQNARDSLTLLEREQRLPPGMAELLDRTAATVQSHALAGEPAWHVPAGWAAREMREHEYRVGLDQRIVHGGKSSLFLRSLAAHPAGGVVLYQDFSGTRYEGRRVRLTGFLRSEAVAGKGTIGLRTNGQSMKAEVTGTTPWKKYELVMDVPKESASMAIMLGLEGAGTMWADDLAFEQVSLAVPLTIQPPENLNFTK
jgi:hypothetical protein